MSRLLYQETFTERPSGALNMWHYRVWSRKNGNMKMPRNLVLFRTKISLKQNIKNTKLWIFLGTWWHKKLRLTKLIVLRIIFDKNRADFYLIPLHSSPRCVTLATFCYWEVWLCCIVGNCIVGTRDGCWSTPWAKPKLTNEICYTCVYGTCPRPSN